MISIVDYGLGNVRAFVTIYRHLNMEVRLVRTAEELAGTDKIILPGVGAFDHAMRKLDESGMRTALERCVMEDGVPILGICVGMQMLARRSDEGERAGLGWVDAEVRRFDHSWFTHSTHLPHMGWNAVNTKVESKLFGGLHPSEFYFLHSYYIDPVHDDDVLAEAEYGNTFCCAVQSKNVFGVQFHPEKSHHWGIQLLKNFGAV